MELPKNGSIVIIDDKVDEALPLMNALAKRGVSYAYYDGRPKSYPAKPLDNIRLIFLDMHLDEVASGASGTKSIVSYLIAGIDAVVNENNGPYVIMVWSKHDSQHLKDLKEAVMDKNGLQCKPIAILNMEKSKCFETADVEKIGGECKETGWKLRDDGIDIIEQNLKNQLEVLDAFVLLYNWENGVRNSAKETIRIISALFSNDSQKWNENIKACMVRMAKAYAGKTIEASDKNITCNAYYSMNSIIDDFNCVEAEKIVDLVNGEIEVLQLREGVKGHIILSEYFDGKEYLLSHDASTYCLYEDMKLIYENSQIKKMFVQKGDDYDAVKQLLCVMYWDNIGYINSLLNIRNYILDQKRPGNIYESSQELKKEICDAHKIDESSQKEVKGIELEISPICDYAQDKRKRLRILPGLQIPATFMEKNISKYTYLSIPMMIDGQVKRLLFDFRYYTAENINYLDEKKPIYAIGDALLQNIKDELSTHGARSGIVYVE